MNGGLSLIVANLGFSISDIIFLLIIVGCIIFFSIDFKQGLIVTMIITGMLFMWYYKMSWDFRKPLITFFISLVLLSLSLLFIDKRQRTGLL